MPGAYAGVVGSPLGGRLAAALGLPRPVPLRRYAADAPLLEGTVLVGGPGDAPLADRARDLLAREGVTTAGAVTPGEPLAAVVADLSAVGGPEDLEGFRALVGPALRSLAPCARVVVVGRDPRSAAGPAQASARRALEGITRSLAKELRAGATANEIHRSVCWLHGPRSGTLSAAPEGP